MRARILPALLWLWTGVCFFTGTNSARAELTYESAEFIDSSFFVMTVQYAYEGDEIKFAVFHRHYGEPGLKCQVVRRVRDGKSSPLSATITLNDTKQKDLLKEGGGYRVDCGVVKQVELKFKPNDLQEFLKSENCNLTIDEFLAHLNRKNV